MLVEELVNAEPTQSWLIWQFETFIIGIII